MSIDLLKKYKDFVSLGSKERIRPYFSLGPLSLNIAAGDSRGIPAGRIIQIVGKQSSGKSTLALDMIHQYQLTNPYANVLYVDFERSFDPRYSQSIGVDLDRIYHVRPDTTEQGFNITEEAIRDADFKLAIIDSIAQAMPSSELGKDYEDSPKMASNAGLITRLMNRIVPILDNNDALLIAINQLRKNFSTLSPETEVPFGGMSLQFAIAMTLHIAKTSTKETFQTSQVIIKKNKTNAPQGRCEFTIQYGVGIRHDLDIINLAIERGLVNKSGAWLSYDVIKSQGLERAATEFPLEEIKQRILGL
jgi:recombination protein RecA